MYNLVNIHGAEIDFVPQNLKNYILNEFNYTNNCGLKLQSSGWVNRHGTTLTEDENDQQNREKSSTYKSKYDFGGQFKDVGGSYSAENITPTNSNNNNQVDTTAVAASNDNLTKIRAYSSDTSKPPTQEETTKGQRASIRELHEGGMQRFVENPVERIKERYWTPSSPSEFSSEEIKVYIECNDEAFYYRALPATLITGTVTLWGAYTERLSPGRFGYMPKLLLYTGVAFVLGKMSYGENCTQKFLQQVPYGNQAQIIRKNRGLAEPLDPIIKEIESSFSSDEAMKSFVQSQESLSTVSGLKALDTTTSTSTEAQKPTNLSKNKYGDVGFELEK